MSPELLLSITNKNDNINNLHLLKTNIYSLGIILIQLIELSFEKDLFHIKEILDKLLNEIFQQLI